MNNFIRLLVSLAAVFSVLSARLSASAAGNVPDPDTGNIGISAYIVPAVLLAVSVIAKKRGGKK